MQKENFKNLLVDLYNIYNPANLAYVDDLVERYSRMEVDAVRNIFIKYNHKSAEHYNPELGTDEYIINIVREYDGGSRILQSVNIKADSIAKKQQNKEKSQLVPEQKITEFTNDIKEQIDKKESDLKKTFQEQIDALKTITSNEIKKFTSEIQKVSDSISKTQEPIVRIFSTYTNSELQLPNKKYLAGLGIGARIITTDESKKVIGLEISDITIDYVSSESGVPIIEITVNKA